MAEARPLVAPETAFICASLAVVAHLFNGGMRGDAEDIGMHVCSGDVEAPENIY